MSASAHFRRLQNALARGDRAARACAMPAAGEPVASTTTSTSGCSHASLPTRQTPCARCAPRVPIPILVAREAGPVRVEVGDDGNFQAAGRRHLREKHRAKLAGADLRATRTGGRIVGNRNAWFNSRWKSAGGLLPSRSACSLVRAAGGVQHHVARDRLHRREVPFGISLWLRRSACGYSSRPRRASGRRSDAGRA